MMRTIILTAAFGAVALCGWGSRAHAVPAFAAQTGQPCTACHVGGFGPELTPYGRLFKISGYTLQGGKGPLAGLPLAAFIQGSYTNTAKGQGGAPAEGYNGNGNFALDQVSLFLAGRLNDHAGAFIQGTYDGVERGIALDNTDLRLTDPVQLQGHDVWLGLSANNGPMVQDPYNTGYAWNYPFYSSQLAPTPIAAPVLGGALLGNTIGLTGTAWIDEKVYLEAGLYETQAPSVLSRLGESYGPGSATAPAPYARIAYEWNWGASSAHVGAAVLHGRFNPPTGPFSATGALGHDTYTDEFFDGGYQYISADGINTATLNGFITHEDRSLRGTAALGGASSPNGSLQDSKLVATYYYDRSYGLTVAWNRVWGSADPILYGQGSPLNGSANGKPDSNAVTLEADWVPFGKRASWGAPLANLKLGVQYTLYTEFDGAARDYDGFGRNASDNDTLFVFAWLVF
jgi:hypothetical protein